MSLLALPMAEQLVYHSGAMPSARTPNFAGLWELFPQGLPPHTGTRPINKGDLTIFLTYGVRVPGFHSKCVEFKLGRWPESVNFEQILHMILSLSPENGTSTV